MTTISDGSIDYAKGHWAVIHGGTREQFRTESEAMDFARLAVDGIVDEAILIQCTPVKRIFRPKIAVESIDAPRRQSKPRKRKGGNGETQTAIGNDSGVTDRPIPLGGQNAPVPPPDGEPELPSD
jgi:hypothetical protein